MTDPRVGEEYIFRDEDHYPGATYECKVIMSITGPKGRMILHTPVGASYSFTQYVSEKQAAAIKSFMEFNRYGE